MRHKLTLWGSVLIVCTAMAVSGAHLSRAVDDLKHTLLDRSEVLARSTEQPLLFALMHADAGAAYGIIHGRFGSEAEMQNFQIEQIVVLNQPEEVFVSTNSERYPPRTKLANLGPEYRALGARLAAAKGVGRLAIEEGGKILLALPLVADGETRGYLVLEHRADSFRLGLRKLGRSTLCTTLLVLAVMLPINWYWGRRIAEPLTNLARHMSNRRPETLPSRTYPYEDEVGQLFKAYDRMCAELQEKEDMKQEMIQSERLAALGRLSASVAHEINNPLAGLITAVDTLKQHGSQDPVTHRVLPLLERGLGQIKGIVSALLVESRAHSHSLSIRDIEDIQTLLAAEVEKQGAHWEWRVGLLGDVPLSATLVRQIMINLVLNAAQAAGPGGQVAVDIRLKPGHLSIDVANDGREIPAEMKRHLFEPFTGTRKGGHGLGLWVTYQIVQQLKGRIKVLGRDGRTVFVVMLPLEDRR
ncbi:MAG TPA: HAMP domain-containing sensor histidine kinase [Thiobacillaceae bacterium]|nr:HAMP domain-containing sensor histidine kinase [Thiobacillaceae bacterium]